MFKIIWFLIILLIFISKINCYYYDDDDDDMVFKKAVIYYNNSTNIDLKDGIYTNVYIESNYIINAKLKIGNTIIDEYNEVLSCKLKSKVYSENKNFILTIEYYKKTDNYNNEQYFIAYYSPNTITFEFIIFLLVLSFSILGFLAILLCVCTLYYIQK